MSITSRSKESNLGEYFDGFIRQLIMSIDEYAGRMRFKVWLLHITIIVSD